MTESITQGIPCIELGDSIKLYKCNDISFTNLKRHHFDCGTSPKKPDQLVVHDGKVLIGIEDKRDFSLMDDAINAIKNNYLPALPETKYFIARAGERIKIFFRISQNQIIEIGTTRRGREVYCFGPQVVTGENADIQENLFLLSKQVLKGSQPTNASLEIDPPSQYYNPLVDKQRTILEFWQKIFVSTGEDAHKCLATFVELLLYKGISDAGMLPHEYSIEHLSQPDMTNSLNTYKRSVRVYIKENLFPTIANQPGIINGFAFQEQETTFKSVLSDLCQLGNLAQTQLDPDFKRRVIEAFLGSAHSEGTIKNGKHLTPRIIIQAIWEMANPDEGKKIVDPACGVGGFILEGLNYPYEFDVFDMNTLGIDRDEQMIITAKANMILHILDRFADPTFDNSDLARKVNSTFFLAKNNGTGTLGELKSNTGTGVPFKAKHSADYVFTNVPYYVNGVKEIDNSLKDIGKDSFYAKCGIGIESRFLKYVLSQIQQGDPGIAFVIVTDGVLYRHKDQIRDVINKNADVMGIISLPIGCFQNNNWKTSILIFQKKGTIAEHAPVFLYNVEHIGVSLDSYRTPTQENDIPSLKREWQRRLSATTTDPNCKYVQRSVFNTTKRWSDLFAWCRVVENEELISFSDFIESAEIVNGEISRLLSESDRTVGDIFSVENYREIELGDTEFFDTGVPDFQTTIHHARINPGPYPIFSSTVDGPVAYMNDPDHLPILIENERNGVDHKLISWNIKGDPAKDIRMHSEPFYVTENRGIIDIKNDQIDFSYLVAYLREHLVNLGNFKRSDEAHAGKVKKIKIKVPVDERGIIDIDKQKEIALKYEKVLKLREQVYSKLNELKILTDNVDVFQ